MSIQQKNINNILILKLSGRLDSNNSLELELLLVETLNTGTNKVIFDFADLNYISSAGLRVILLVGKKLRISKGALALSGLRDNVQEVFYMSGFQAIIPIYTTVEEAMQYIEANPIA